MSSTTSFDGKIKDIMYEVIKEMGAERIRSEASSGSCDNIMNKLFTEAKKRASCIDKSCRTDAILATSLLHYMLTLCLVPSQRKIAYDNAEIDIVIPGMRELKADPKNALVIMISNMPDISDIQPHSENIWAMSKKYDSRIVTFDMGSNHDVPFFHIVDKIRAFVSERVTSLKIFGT